MVESSIRIITDRTSTEIRFSLKYSAAKKILEKTTIGINKENKVSGNSVILMGSSKIILPKTMATT